MPLKAESGKQLDGCSRVFAILGVC